MLIDPPFNDTQLVGLFCFGAACFSAWRTSGSLLTQSMQKATRWRWIASFQLAYLFEILLGTRHLAHDFVNTTLRAMGWYQDRASIQILLLLGVSVCGFVIGLVLWRWIRRHHLHSGAEKVALLFTAVALLLFLVETISLHAIDRVLYRQVGPVLLITYLWAIASLGVVFAARHAGRTH